MMLKKTILTLCFCYFLTTSFACTTFVLKTTNHLVFGRNLDWVSDNGIIVTNKRNVAKKALYCF